MLLYVTDLGPSHYHILLQSRTSCVNSITIVWPLLLLMHHPLPVWGRGTKQLYPGILVELAAFIEVSCILTVDMEGLPFFSHINHNVTNTFRHRSLCI
jgi:hypothetical protein